MVDMIEQITDRVQHIQLIDVVQYTQFHTWQTGSTDAVRHVGVLFYNKVASITNRRRLARGLPLLILVRHWCE
jgi:hypothetical protein